MPHRPHLLHGCKSLLCDPLSCYSPLSLFSPYCFFLSLSNIITATDLHLEPETGLLPYNLSLWSLFDPDTLHLLLPPFSFIFCFCFLFLFSTSFSFSNSANMDFIRTTLDHCVLPCSSSATVTDLNFYVDDIIISRSDTVSIAELKAYHSSQVHTKDLGLPCNWDSSLKDRCMINPTEVCIRLACRNWYVGLSATKNSHGYTN